jgi:colanic acid/amylovoran biosynthesis glycosyltransferase
LFGVVAKPKEYESENIKIYRTPYSHVLNLLYTIWRSIHLLFKNPKDLATLINEIKTYPTLYDQWISFSKFLPMILYKPDMVHMQWARDLEFYMFLKRRFQIPLIVSLRGAHINYSPIVEPELADIYRETFKEVSGFHAVSKAIALEAEKYGAISTKTKVIYSMIPKRFFDAYTPYVKKEKRTLEWLSIGRFHWKKGYSYALDALLILKQSGFDVSYTIVGPRQYTEAILFQIHDLGLQDQVTLIDHVSQQQLIALMTSKDGLILPSLEEGIANVVIESMAMGLPVVSTDCGGMAEVVIPNETGWLVPVRSPGALAKAIIEVTKASEKELQRITKQAHELVKDQFDAEKSINRFLELYQEVLISRK